MNLCSSEWYKYSCIVNRKQCRSKGSGPLWRQFLGLCLDGLTYTTASLSQDRRLQTGIWSWDTHLNVHKDWLKNVAIEKESAHVSCTKQEVTVVRRARRIK
jgi:hypothetical protein